MIKTFAVVMAGGSIHGKILLKHLLKNKLSPNCIVIEKNTKRATKHINFLKDASGDLPPIEYFIDKLKTNVLIVSDYNNYSSIDFLKKNNFQIGVNGGADIFSVKLLSTANEFFINGHPGILPDYRGLDPVLWSLIENGPLGATLHKIDQDVDSGIIFKKIITKKTFFHDIIDLRIYCINLCAKLVVEYLKNEIHMKPKIPILADYQVRGKFNMDDYGIVINKFKKRFKTKK